MNGPPEDPLELLPACRWQARRVDRRTRRWYGEDDLVQEFFVAAWAAAATFDPSAGRSWASYLFRGLRMRALTISHERTYRDFSGGGVRGEASVRASLRRYEGPRSSRSNGYTLPVSDHGPRAVDDREEVAAVLSKIERPRGRLAARLIGQEGLSVADVAALFDVSRQAVWQMLRPPGRKVS